MQPGILHIRPLVAATLLLAFPAVASADWIFTVYLGASRTAPNDITIEPAAGGTIAVDGISYQTMAFESPVYYGGRLTFFLPQTPWLGVGVEFTHNKATADIDQMVTIDGAAAPLSSVLGRLELTNGLNFGLVNVVVRRPMAIGDSTDRLMLTAFGGLGAAIPHVETYFAGQSTFEYQLTGLGWQIGAGAEWRLVGGLTAVADTRVTGGRQRLDMGTGILEGGFTSAQIDFGVAWRFGRAPAANRETPTMMPVEGLGPQ